MAFSFSSTIVKPKELKFCLNRSTSEQLKSYVRLDRYIKGYKYLEKKLQLLKYIIKGLGTIDDIIDIKA